LGDWENREFMSQEEIRRLGLIQSRKIKFKPLVVYKDTGLSNRKKS